ncbi:MAG TPA: hypothetical protein VF897_04840 [Roseiflexaceae bacterium]
MSGRSRKLERAWQRLAEAGTNSDLVGLALLSFHGALEDHFRQWLGSDPRMPQEQRDKVAQIPQGQWKDLLDLMKQYGGLESYEREWIEGVGKIRHAFAHGDSYDSTPEYCARYGTFVVRLCDEVYPLVDRSFYAHTRPGSLKSRSSPPADSTSAQRRPPQSPPTGGPSNQPEPSQPKPGGAMGSGLVARLLIFLVVAIAFVILLQYVRVQ